MKPNPVLRKATEICIGLTAIATLILAGCGGGGGAASAGGGVANTTLIISPSLGMFWQGANVRIRDRSGTEIGKGYTNASGVASISVPTSAQAPLLVEAGLTGDKYYDEKQGIFVTISGVTGAAVRALIPDHTVTSQVAVTALTEIAVGLMTNASGVMPAGVTAASAVGANATVAQSFGVNDLLLPPTVVASNANIAALGTTEANKYALKLAALAQMAGAGEDALKVAHRLRNDLNLTTPASGIAATISAMNAAFANIASATAGARTAAGVTVPPANAKLFDMIPAAMAAANTALMGQTGKTNAQIVQALNAAAISNASRVMAAIAAGSSPAAAVAGTAWTATTGGGAVASVPAAPTGVTATAISSTQINLSWTSVTGAQAYYVYRATSPNLAVSLMTNVTSGSAMVGPSTVATTLNDTYALAAGTTYYYKVVALNAIGSSAASSEMNATTNAAAVVVVSPAVAGGQATAVTTFAGLAGQFGAVDGIGSAARFYSPGGVAVDGTGNVYVADATNNNIRKH